MASNDGEVKIPSIDFCKKELKPGTSQWETTKEQVFKALQEYGCFEAIYEKVPNEIREAMFDTLQQVLPLRNKLMEYYEKPLALYDGLIPNFPFYENIVNGANLFFPHSVETFVNTLWPDGNPNYCNVIRSFTNPLVELDEMVKRMVLESLGLKDYIDEFLKFSNVYTMRLTKYIKAAKGEDKVKIGAPAHTDSTFLTIIKAVQPGLQVLPKNGDKWIEPNISPNSYFVFAGDSLQVWTNGRVHSLYHKVILNQDTDRFSVQLFASPKPGCIIEAPKELVDEEHPSLFKPFDVAGYYKYCMSGAKDGYGLKAYLGISAAPLEI